ncbi:hypothetical protein [Nostoc sp.]|uniref:hypothetical protein n=1 Tax=Nostoc sp. TaxID=1180 RepID=UPI002FF72BF7
MQNKSTLWRNDKTRNIYSVWLVARDKHRVEFTVYQKPEILKPNKASLLVRHSESLLIGKCEFIPDFKWLVDFEISFGDIELADRELPWCRPSGLWFNKFTPLDEQGDRLNE